MEVSCTRRCEAHRNRKKGPKDLFLEREGCRLACWPLGGCGQHHRCRGECRFFSIVDSLRASERIDRSAGANRRLRERAVFRGGLSASFLQCPSLADSPRKISRSGCNLWAEPAMILPLSRQGGPSSCIPTGTRNIRRSIRNRSAILDHNESRRLLYAIEWEIVAKNDCT